MNTIVLRDFSLAGATAAEEARSSRDHLLDLCKQLPSITDAATQATATDLLRNLRNFYKVIEEGRQAAKAPVLKLERDIDALARELAEDVEAQGKRLSAILGAYDIEQKRIVEQKRQEALAEEQRLKDEAASKQKAIDDAKAAADKKAADELAAETARIIQEADAKAARARTPEGAKRAIESAAKEIAAVKEVATTKAVLREEQAAERKEHVFEQTVTAVAATRENAFALTASKPKDTRTSEVIMFEVSDIVALYEAAPYLVRLEPNVAAIKSALKGLQGGQTLPGVKHWKEATTITRG